MSMCDKCYAPGQCCKRINLYVPERGNVTFWDDEPVADQLAIMAQNDPLPFKATEKIETFRDDESGRNYSRWHFSCTKLLPNGRCGDYENRPKLCRIFEPGSNALCVHFMGAEGTGDGL